MAPLSKEMSGTILPHDRYGSHLDGSCRTVDLDLELRNFEYAGQVLADIWDGMTIDGFIVRAQYTPPGSEAPTPIPQTHEYEWYAQHV